MGNKSTNIVIYTRISKNNVKKLTFKNVREYEVCRGFLSMTMKSGKVINYNLNAIEMFEENEVYETETFTAMNPPEDPYETRIKYPDGTFSEKL